MQRRQTYCVFHFKLQICFHFIDYEPFKTGICCQTEKSLWKNSSGRNKFVGSEFTLNVAGYNIFLTMVFYLIFIRYVLIANTLRFFLSIIIL